MGVALGEEEANVTVSRFGLGRGGRKKRRQREPFCQNQRPHQPLRRKKANEEHENAHYFLHSSFFVPHGFSLSAGVLCPFLFVSFLVTVCLSISLLLVFGCDFGVGGLVMHTGLIFEGLQRETPKDTHRHPHSQLQHRVHCLAH